MTFIASEHVERTDGALALDDLLQKGNLDPATVLVFRHTAKNRNFHEVLPWLAAERPEVFNAYQQTQQDQRVEDALGRSAYVASFFGHESGKALFVGLYEVGPSTAISREEYWEIPAYLEMAKLGMTGFTEESRRPFLLWFELKPLSLYAQWSGKLVVSWPAGERQWWRRAHKNSFKVLAIHEESIFAAPVPTWDQLLVSWRELGALPKRWADALAQWRGIYLIFDTSDGKAYVGSASGIENLLGRWRNYANTRHGGNRTLRHRNPQNFRFSILQRVSPDMPPEEVVQIESSWKMRLHTRSPHGLNDN